MSALHLAPELSPWLMPASTPVNYWIGNTYIGAFSRTVNLSVRLDGGAWTLIGSANPDLTGTWTSPSDGPHLVDFYSHSDPHFDSGWDNYSYATGLVMPPGAPDAYQGQVGYQDTRVSGYWHDFWFGADQYVALLDWPQPTPTIPPWSGRFANRLPAAGPWTFIKPTTLTWNYTSGDQAYLFASINEGPWQQIVAHNGSGSGTWTLDTSVAPLPADLDLWYVSYRTTAEGSPSSYYTAGTPSASISFSTGAATVTWPGMTVSFPWQGSQLAMGSMVI